MELSELDPIVTVDNVLNVVIVQWMCVVDCIVVYGIEWSVVCD